MPLFELFPKHRVSPSLTKSNSEEREPRWFLDRGSFVCLTPREDPRHLSSNSCRVHNGPSHSISHTSSCPPPQILPQVILSFIPGLAAGNRPGPYRGWADLANARLLGDGPDFRDVTKRVSELGPARLEHRALRRRQEVVGPRLHGGPEEWARNQEGSDHPYGLMAPLLSETEALLGD